MRQYELLLLFTPDQTDEDVETFLQELGSQLKDFTVTEKDLWGKKNLAQPVQDYKEGVYLLLHLTADKEDLKELENILRMNAKVLRFVLLKIEQRKKSRYSAPRFKKPRFSPPPKPEPEPAPKAESGPDEASGNDNEESVSVKTDNTEETATTNPEESDER